MLTVVNETSPDESINFDLPNLLPRQPMTSGEEFSKTNSGVRDSSCMEY